MDNNLLILYCFVDDFCKKFIPLFESKLLKSGHRKRIKPSKLSYAEVMTIIIYFHQLGFRNFKSYYNFYVKKHLNNCFLRLVSYNRFIELKSQVLVPLCMLMHCLKGKKTGIYFVDSTTIKVCHIKREKSNKVFAGMAKKAKSSMGWFYGFKLHLIINDKGEIMSFKITKGNSSDVRNVESLTEGLSGSLIGDKGYISKNLFDNLYSQGLKLITKIKKNMENKLMPLFDKFLLNKRAIIESTFNQLKTICQIEHSRHRSSINFAVNLIAGLVAYSVKPKKPSLKYT